jgi:uncharacterized protein (UPF0276 family)
LPDLGIGFGLRREIADETFEAKDKIDFLEFAPENYMEVGGNAKALLERAAEAFPLISHGLCLSIGSTDDLNNDYLKALKKTLDQANCAWASDHLCFASFNGVYVQDLLPLPFSKEAIEHVVKRIKTVQDYIERPFLLENISYYTSLPGAEMNEWQFISEILEKADCGLLLDVNNVYVNSVNHGFDPERFVDQIPLERVVQIHIAGHKKSKKTIIDTHGAPVVQAVYDLLEYTIGRVDVKGVMLERDQNFPNFDEIIVELEKIRNICDSNPGSKMDLKKCGTSKKAKSDVQAVSI